MYIDNISLVNFRNYDNLTLKLKQGINIIYGNNAQGKTNLLESIYVLALTKSHRSFIDNNLIKNNKDISKIEGNIFINKMKNNFKIIIGNKNKKLKIDNDEIKKISDYISKLNIIIFYPEDLDLIKGSPNIRRHFLNSELSQLNNKYLNILGEYNKILKMRNDYIKLIFEGKTSDYNYFNILTDYLIEKAIQIYQYRNNFINQLNNISSNIFKNISSINGFNIKYKNSIKFDNYDSEEIRKKLKNYYNKNFEREIKFKTTLIGPHRDDFEFYIEKFNLKNYGSQGQQRMSILAIKLAEIEIFYETKKEYPILLLDDVFSELDDQKKNNLLNYIKDNMQTIITTTDLKNIDESIINKSKLIEIKNGKITKEVN